jgi:hypothetical protein
VKIPKVGDKIIFDDEIYFDTVIYEILETYQVCYLNHCKLLNIVTNEIATEIIDFSSNKFNYKIL